MSVDYAPTCPDCGDEMSYNPDDVEEWVCQCGKRIAIPDNVPDYNEAE